ncbi:sensor histidine kinase [Haliovirga abyssi]|uniref:HAMP domain-containing protein n=1 Tax=Haliovirga abyssi TaxID=2996794 RepID=A0AAU9DH69_9FUSO|nr:histidine kinase [Haliovirga abyssi]BDU51638.1 hypothetical protein HLVA_22070 [Haliovirga abyssi]
MNLKKRKFFKDELRKTFILYALIPSLLFSIFFYNILIFYNKKMIKERNRKNNNHVSQIIEKELNDYKKEINFLTNNIDIKEIINGNKNKAKIYEGLYKFVNERKIKSIFYIFDKNGNIIITNAWQKIKENNKNYDLLEEIKINSDKIMLMRNQYQINRDNKKVYSLGKTIKNKSNKIIGYILFELLEKDLNNIIYNDKVDLFAVTDNFKNVIATTNNFMINEIGKLIISKINNEYIRIDRDDYYVYKTDILKGKLSIYTLTPMGLINKFYIIGLMFLIVSFVFLTLLFWLISKKISVNKSKSVDELLYAIKKVQSGNLDTFVNIKTNDEFELLGDYYNEMIIRLDEVIKTNKEQVKRNKMVEIKQLESQFNPHFLFNTLEILKYMIKIEPKKAIKIVVSMANLLRYSINYERENICLIEDIKYIKDYMVIQKIRFDKKLDYEISIEDRVEKCIIPKLILQPLVENSIKYGFDKNNYLKIKLMCFIENDYLILKIIDSGNCISDEKLKEIKNLLKKVDNNTNHIGMYNAQRRIKLIYGVEYGIVINNIKNEGVEVMIKLPIIIEKVGNQNEYD